MSRPHNKFDKIPDGEAGARYIPKNKAGLFRVLLIKIIEAKGGQKQALKYIPISGKTRDMVMHGLVTSGTARRILNAYNKIKKN